MGQEINPDNFGELPQLWTDKTSLAEKTIEQVNKDFRLQGIDLNFSLSTKPYEKEVLRLSRKLEEIDFLHHPKLIPILYQVDLIESELRDKIQATSPEKIYLLISEELLKRCFSKVLWREKFKSGGN